MPKIARGSHVYRRRRMPTSNDIPQPEGTPSPPPGAFSLTQLTSATQEVIMQAGGSSTFQLGQSAASLLLRAPGPSVAFSDPSSISPSTPSSFLASSAGGSAPSSVLTSVSRSAKRRISSTPSVIESESSARKRTRRQPISVTAQAQKDGSETMKELAVYIKDFLETSPQITQAASASSSDPLARAVVLLSGHTTLTEDDRLEIADYFARDKAQAVIFANFPETTRVAWLEKTLRKLKSNTSHDDDIVMV
jgi:hypothetical protein